MSIPSVIFTKIVRILENCIVEFEAPALAFGHLNAQLQCMRRTKCLLKKLLNCHKISLISN